jgi:hypothetical protein
MLQMAHPRHHHSSQGIGGRAQGVVYRDGAAPAVLSRGTPARLRALARGAGRC